MDHDLRWTFIAWAPYSRRSEVFARALGGSLHCIHYLRFQSPPFAPAKYILQSIRTWQVLKAERPQTVHVQNPPFVCGLAVYLYCQLAGATFVLDHHSAAFAPIWAWASPVQEFLARRAVTNIVTNQHWADIVRSWGAQALIMGDPFLELPQGRPFPVGPAFNVAVISTFAPDEPLHAVVIAATRLPEVHFYISGDTRRVSAGFLSNLPNNVTCTGFLPDSQYVGLLAAVDAVMVLTTRDYTLQLGGCEAVSAGQPLLTSNWPFLQSFFPQGTIYVANTADGIQVGVLEMQTRHLQLKEEMAKFRETARQDWVAQSARLRQLVTTSMPC